MISSDNLSNRSFCLTEGGGLVIAPAVFLLPDGRVFGTRHTDASFWEIIDDYLEFLDQQRTVTARFTEISHDANGWRLKGLFLVGGQPYSTRILDETPVPIDSRDFGRSPTGTTLVVMVRTNFIDDRVVELVCHLNHGRRNFDLYVVADETNGRSETELKNVIWYSTDRGFELGLTQRHDRLMWWCGDIPFYIALSQLPQYHYYAIIDDDIHLTHSDASLFNMLAEILISGEAGRIDAIGTRLRRENPRDNGIHLPAFAYFETTYSYFFPVILLSRPAASYLYAQRLIEAARASSSEKVIHCESFVPSHLIRAGFSCVDLNAVLPGSYRNDLMILPGRQNGIPRSFADGFIGFVRMIRPVYSDSVFLQRLLNGCQDDAQKQALLQRLDSGEFDLIPANVRATFRAHLTEPGGGPSPGLCNHIIYDLAMGHDAAAVPDLLYGWAQREAGFTWSIGTESALRLPQPSAPYGGFLEFTLVPFRSQRLGVTVNGTRIGATRLDRGSQLAFRVPPHPSAEDGMRVVLEHPDATSPLDIGSSSDVRKLAFAMHGIRYVLLDAPMSETDARRSADRLEIAQAVDRETAISMTEAAIGGPVSALLMGFASIGDNCEFGMLQRLCGIEPLGLLRFSSALLHHVIRGIDTGFAGLGDPGDVVPRVAKGGWSEWMIHEKHYGLDYHTDIRESDANAEQVLLREIVKLHFLRRTFMEDLAEGRKIYVCKRSHQPLTLNEVMPLFLALNRHAASKLLFVIPADETHPVGTVIEELPGLMRGHIDSFAPSENVPRLSVPGWLAVCVNTWRLVGGDHGDGVDNP